MQLQEWHDTTYLFYLSVIVLAWLLSNILKKYSITTRYHKCHLGVVIPLFVLFFVKAFSACGTDLLGGYHADFMSSTSWAEYHDHSMEIGHILLNILVRAYVADYPVMVFLYAVITFAPVYYLINKYFKEIDAPFTIAAYAAIFLLPGISLIRIYLAASLSLMSFDAIKDGKTLRSLLFIFVASLFHISAISVLIPWFAAWRRIRMRTFALVLCFGVILLYTGKELFSIFFEGRYALYSFSESLDIGVAQMFYNIPLILVYLYSRNLKDSAELLKNDNTSAFCLSDVSFYWVLFAFFIGMISYAIPILGRIAAFSVPIIFLLGAGLYRIKMASVRSYFIVAIAVSGYLLVRYHYYISEYYILDGIMPYVNIFGWII